MHCLWLEQKTVHLKNDVPIPTPREHEALVRVRLAGICATDQELMRGYFSYTGIPGHEFVGEIVKAPSAPQRIGERVVGEINAACGNCDFCQRGLSRHCRRRTVLGIVNHHGAFAEYLVLPLDNLIVVPDTVSDEEAVFTEPIAAALEIQEQIAIRPTDKVLLIGAGKLGQLIAQTLALTGCDLTVAAKYPRQHSLLQQRGISAVSPEQIPSASFDLVVESTGSPSGFATARHAVRPRGTLVLKSTYQGTPQVDWALIIVDEITLVGSRCGPFKPALQLLKNKLVDPTPLIEARFPMVQGVEAFAHANRDGALKVLLTFGV